TRSRGSPSSPSGQPLRRFGDGGAAHCPASGKKLGEFPRLADFYSKNLFRSVEFKHNAPFIDMENAT
ncbi:hypothetical protein, partial [Burkholderia pseudomallei]|uniref:hypothetical protein n=1 Tax=Burkholderia pseudomallei TaxID=28450 RepID=UPI001C4AB1E8